MPGTGRPGGGGQAGGAQASCSQTLSPGGWASPSALPARGIGVDTSCWCHVLRVAGSSLDPWVEADVSRGKEKIALAKP